MVDRDDDRTLRAYGLSVVRVEDDPQTSNPRTSFPSLAREWRTKTREIVAFDKTIEHSPLTLDSTTVRGLHVKTNGLELHAGVTSPVLYQNIFLSTQSETVLGASYEYKRGRSSLVPSVYSFPSEAQTGGTSGTLGSVCPRAFGGTRPWARYRRRRHDDLGCHN